MKSLLTWDARTAWWWGVGGMLLIAQPSFAHDEDWVLMSRHGECFPINTALDRKIEGLPHIDSPIEFIKAMEKRGWSARQRIEGNSVVVDVPEKGWSLIFVERYRCNQ